MILVLIDTHSKWIEAVCTPSATSSAVIEELRTLFAQFGIPETIVTDNGSCFVSAEIEAFFESNGIKHITSAPYHPASNGLAERAVQIVKRGLKKITQGSMRSRLAKTLFTYCLTPQTTTGISPGELLLGRCPRSRLDLLKPHTAERVERSQIKQKEQHDSKSRERKLNIGNNVFVKNYHHGDKWLPGVIQKKTGPVSFVVRLTDGRLRCCHQDQLCRHSVEVHMDSSVESEVFVSPTEVSLPLASPTEPPVPTPETNVERPSAMDPSLVILQIQFFLQILQRKLTLNVLVLL